MPTLTHELAQHYQNLWDKRQIDPDKRQQVQNIVDKILLNKKRYISVENKTDVPWFVISAIHSLESSLSFSCHLHNGDSLKNRTIHVPQNRPPLPAMPPFTWEESAVDALKYDGLASWKVWDLVSTLFKLEGYNGWGYLTNHPDVPSPYLWAGASNIYKKGKYTSDGRFDPNAVSKQIGAACILGLMDYEGIIKLERL